MIEPEPQTGRLTIFDALEDLRTIQHSKRRAVLVARGPASVGVLAFLARCGPTAERIDEAEQFARSAVRRWSTAPDSRELRAFVIGLRSKAVEAGILGLLKVGRTPGAEFSFGAAIAALAVELEEIAKGGA